MIVNPRGTFGSGKSTIVRRVMERYATREPAYAPGRRRPYGWTCIADGHPNLWVVGDYNDSPCGGADTIPKIEDIMGQVRNAAEMGYDVIYEGGTLAAHDRRRIAEINKTYPVTTICLLIPVDQAIAGVMERRAARGDERPFDPKNVHKEHRVTELSARALTDMGVTVKRASTREQALAFALEALGWNS